MPEAQHVPVNVYETEGAVVIVAPLPGVMADDIEIHVDGRNVTLRAGLRSEAQKRDYLLHEWDYGPYERTVEIPAGFGGGASASFGNGQLALRVLKGDGGPSGRVAVNTQG
jgi:HSP20 family protein